MKKVIAIWVVVASMFIGNVFAQDTTYVSLWRTACWTDDCPSSLSLPDSLKPINRLHAKRLTLVLLCFFDSSANVLGVQPTELVVDRFKSNKLGFYYFNPLARAGSTDLSDTEAALYGDWGAKELRPLISVRRVPGRKCLDKMTKVNAIGIDVDLE